MDIKYLNLDKYQVYDLSDKKYNKEKCPCYDDSCSRHGVCCECINRWRLILGICIAILTSFCWYSFSYVMSEAIRFSFYVPFSISRINYVLLLTDEEVLFYNFIFALIASIFGLSACFQILFHRARQYKEKSIEYIRRSSIFTDVTGLNSIFLFWFTNITLVFVF